MRGSTDAQVARSICPYCGVGCGQLIYHKDGKLISIEGDPEIADQPGKSLPERRGVISIAHARSARDENEISRAARERVDGHFARSRDGHGGGSRLGIAQTHVRAQKKTARRSITRRRSAISAAPRSTTKKIISSENYSLSAWGWCAYPTRRGYDIAARCPVWAPPSAGAELRPRNKISPTPIAF